jgi:bis(5'-adenosyl)-triphosphatase
VHVIPRIRGSTAKPASTPSDAVYEGMAGEEGNVGGGLWDRYFYDGHGVGAGVEDGENGGSRGSGEAGEEGGRVVMTERPVPGGSFPSIEDAARAARGMGEMEAEAAVYKAVLEGMGSEGV